MKGNTLTDNRLLTKSFDLDWRKVKRLRRIFRQRLDPNHRWHVGVYRRRNGEISAWSGCKGWIAKVSNGSTRNMAINLARESNDWLIQNAEDCGSDYLRRGE